MALVTGEGRHKNETRELTAKLAVNCNNSDIIRLLDTSANSDKSKDAIQYLHLFPR